MEDITQGIECAPIFGPPSANMFKYVKTNVPGPGCELDLFTDEFQGCLCDGICSEELCACFNIFGPAYHNGLLREAAFSSGRPSRSILECGDNCKCSPSMCGLRLVQRGIQAKLRVINTSKKGYGLQAEHKITRLSFVCEYAGEVVGESEAKSRLAECEKLGNMNYLIAIGEGSSLSYNQTYVDPRLQGNIGRFINHSCDPNLIMIPVRLNHSVPRLALFARREIHVEEELTFDYSGCTSLEKDNSIILTPKDKSPSQCLNISRDTSSMLPDTHLDTVNHLINPQTSENAKAMKREGVDSVESEEAIRFVKRRKFAFDSELMQDASCSFQDSNKSCCKNIGLAPECTMQSIPKDSSSIPCKGKEENKIGSVSNLSLSIDSSNVKRKPCFCKSKNCKGFLPYESQLFQMPSLT